MRLFVFMVTVIDGYAKGVKETEDREIIFGLVEKVFGKPDKFFGKGLDLTIWCPNSTPGEEVIVEAGSRSIDVYNPADYAASLKLANMCEECLKVGFRLTTHYKNSNSSA